MNMKRIFVMMLALCMALTLFACGDSNETTPNTTQAPATTNKPVPTTTVPATTSDGKVDYTVTVLYPDGTPVVDTWVIVCTESMCYTSNVPTDANGKVVFRLAEMDGYKAKWDETLAGYQEMTDYIYFETGSKEVTITLVPVE